MQFVLAVCLLLLFISPFHFSPFPRTAGSIVFPQCLFVGGVKEKWMHKPQGGEDAEETGGDGLVQCANHRFIQNHSTTFVKLGYLSPSTFEIKSESEGKQRDGVFPNESNTTSIDMLLCIKLHV